MKEAVNRLILEEEPGNTECDKDENIIVPFCCHEWWHMTKARKFIRNWNPFYYICGSW